MYPCSVLLFLIIGTKRKLDRTNKPQDHYDGPSAAKYGYFVAASSTPDANKESVSCRRYKSENKPGKICYIQKAYVTSNFKYPTVLMSMIYYLSSAMPSFSDVHAEHQTEASAPHPLSKFILVRLEYTDDDNPANILNRSAGFCKMTTTWDFNIRSTENEVSM